MSRIASPAGPASPPRSYPGAEPLFSTSLAFVGRSDSRLISASGNLLTLWNLRQYSRIGRAARILMPWRCGRVCPGPRLAIGPGGREAAMTDSNGSLLVRAGLGPSFGKITTLARGGTGQFGLPLWSRTGNRLYRVRPDAVAAHRREGALRSCSARTPIRLRRWPSRRPGTGCSRSTRPGRSGSARSPLVLPPPPGPW